MGLIDKFNLFNWVFPNLNVNKNFIEERDPVVQIALLLGNNDSGSLPKVLNKLKFPADEAKAITFLTLLPQLSVETVFNMKKLQKNSKASNSQVLDFARHNNLDINLITKFLEWDLSVSGQAVMDEFGVKGPEVGKMIQQMETKLFQKTLG
jgi:hypothetical protein